MEIDKTSFKFSIIAIISIVIFCVAIAPITLQNDTYYTISIGKHILENGIDMQDAFSWHNLPYTYPHWGYDVLIYLIYAGFGMVGIYGSTCFLSAILGIILYITNCKVTKNHVISFMITLITIFLIKDYIAARAQLVTFILFVLTILFIEKFLETKKIKYAIGLIIIPIVIANVHVAVWPFYFILYLPYVGEYLISILADEMVERNLKKKNLKKKIKKLEAKEGQEEKRAKLLIKLTELNALTEKAKAKRKEAKKDPYKLIINKNDNVKWLIVIMLICALTGLLTPLKEVPYTYLIKTMQGHTTENINEHLPMTLIEHEGIFCLLISYLALMTFTKVKIRLNDLFMLAGLGFLMFYSRRQSTMFILIGSVILNKLIFEVLETYIKKGTEEKLLIELSKKVASALIIILILSISYHFMIKKKNDTFIDGITYPVAACDYIIDNIDLKNARFYNDYNYGSYMIFRGIPVFIDSRADLYAPEFNTPTGNPKDGKDIFMDFIEVSGIKKYYDPVFDDYKMTHVITTRSSKLAMLIDNRNDKKYKEVFSDGHFVIYEINRTD